MELINDTTYELDSNIVRKVMEFVLKSEGREGKVSVAFVNAEKMKELNEKFRNGEGPTDVLTFLYDDEDMLGEVVICPEVVERNAREFGVSFDEEMLLTLVHSALHLCGYDHEFSKEREREMMEKQRVYFERLRDELL